MKYVFVTSTNIATNIETPVWSIFLLKPSLHQSSYHTSSWISTSPTDGYSTHPSELVLSFPQKLFKQSSCSSLLSHEKFSKPLSSKSLEAFLLYLCLRHQLSRVPWFCRSHPRLLGKQTSSQQNFSCLFRQVCIRFANIVYWLGDHLCQLGGGLWHRTKAKRWILLRPLFRILL